MPSSRAIATRSSETHHDGTRPLASRPAHRPRSSDALIHGDLHPDNVMLTTRGPVVIDWTNAAIGPRGMDAANTWVLMASAELEGGRVARAVQAGGRAYFIRRFLRRCDRERLAALLPAAAAHRVRDPNVRPSEVASIRRLVERVKPPSNV